MPAEPPLQFPDASIPQLPDRVKTNQGHIRPDAVVSSDERPSGQPAARAREPRRVTSADWSTRELGPPLSRWRTGSCERPCYRDSNVTGQGGSGKRLSCFCREDACRWLLACAEGHRLPPIVPGGFVPRETVVSVPERAGATARRHFRAKRTTRESRGFANDPALGKSHVGGDKGDLRFFWLWVCGRLCRCLLHGRLDERTQ